MGAAVRIERRGAAAEQLELEAAIQQQQAATADFVEGMAAFVEKRAPRFRGA